MNYSNQDGVKLLSALRKKVCKIRELSQLWGFHFLQHAVDGGVLRLMGRNKVSRECGDNPETGLFFFLNNWSHPQFNFSFILAIILGFE